MKDIEINKKIILSDLAFKKWREVSIDDRAKLFLKLAEILESEKEVYGRLITKEVGKPISQSIAEIEKSAWVCRYYAKNAKKFLKAKKIKTENKKSFIRFDPLGVIFAIMPWNFPFWQVFRFAVPTLMAGNVAILKHASNVSLCSKEIEKIFIKACFPENVFSSFLIASKQASNVIENSLVKAVTLTGSVKAGFEVAGLASQNGKKAVLELGGSDPYLILKDADLKKAANVAVTSRMINAGQSCIAAKRFIVDEEIYDDFIARVILEMKEYKMGLPQKKETKLGPLSSEFQRDEVHDQVLKSVKKGAKLILGGEIPKRKGNFYPATILIDVKKGMPAYSEEIFGPVAVIIKAKDEEDAIRIANDTEFGLGAAIFSKNIKKAERLVSKIDSGNVFINDFVKSDPRLPFGGVKNSGYGRELSEQGIREFVNIKTVSIS